MFLVRLIYASSVKSDFDKTVVESILEASRRNNIKANITGMLYFNNNYFLQCLEGSRSSVNETYNKILTDERHHQVTAIEYREISSREFEDWSMGYVPSRGASTAALLKFSVHKEFNPYLMSGESAHNLLCALKADLPSF